MEEALNYSTFQGTKLEYCETENGSYTQIKGLTSVPDIGGEPNSIDTTTLDNLKYETSKYGFQYDLEHMAVF